ncbi:hypothetical protein RA27_00010 [Ruegeria sp. ANG-R]|uniref:hypothetical protein n=1 Tax=Ruegeria sp. ANG-R TaxID=1577903 RepID=UPI00057D624E|nr:hypothetical protein [Ruegeria sp. ANG-R]KIC41847.1 hypothetical protein RA27_00010 [Ruegeria sp. ANG-R]
MFGFEFLNYGAQILHSKDLDDMRAAVLDDDDQEIDCNVSDFCRERQRFDIRHGELSGKA